VVVVVADADDLVAEVGGAIRGLKAGENRIELPAGDHTVVVRTKAGKAIGSYPVQVPSGGEARVQIVSTGVVVVPAREGRVVEVDGKAVEAKDGRYEIRRGAGKVPVVVKEAGKVGRKGEVDILVGKTATLDPTLEAFSAGNKNVALACILGGGALVLGGTLMEVFADADAVGGDGTRWALMGIGTAAFVGGTIWMKDILAKENSPPVQPGTFDVKFAATRGGAAARLTLRF